MASDLIAYLLTVASKKNQSFNFSPNEAFDLRLNPVFEDWLAKIRQQVMDGVPRDKLAPFPTHSYEGKPLRGKLNQEVKAVKVAIEDGTEIPDIPIEEKFSGKGQSRERGYKPTNEAEVKAWNDFVSGGGLAKYNGKTISESVQETLETAGKDVVKTGTFTGKVVTPEGEFDSTESKSVVDSYIKKGYEFVPSTDDDGNPIWIASDSWVRWLEESRNFQELYDEKQPDGWTLVARPKFEDSPKCREIGDRFLRSTTEKWRAEQEEWICRVTNLHPERTYKNKEGKTLIIPGLPDPTNPEKLGKVVPGIYIPESLASIIFKSLKKGQPLRFTGHPGTGKTMMAKKVAQVRGGCFFMVPPLGEEAEERLFGQWSYPKQIITIEQAKIFSDQLRALPDNPKYDGERARLQKLIADAAEPYDKARNWQKGDIEQAMEGKFHPFKKDLKGRPLRQGCLCLVDEANRYSETAQNRMLHVVDQKEMPIPMVSDPTESVTRAIDGFNMIVTTNENDRGVSPMSGALARRFQSVAFIRPPIEKEQEIMHLKVEGTTDKTKICDETSKIVKQAVVAARSVTAEQDQPTTAEMIRAYEIMTSDFLKDLGIPKSERNVCLNWNSFSPPQKRYISEQLATLLTRESDDFDKVRDKISSSVFLSTTTGSGSLRD